MKSKARLIIASSEHDADMLYATRFFAPDAFIFLQKGGRKIIVLNDLEIDRGRKHAKVDRIVSYSEIARRTGKNAPFAAVVAQFLREEKIRGAEVPANFPIGLARHLKNVRLTPVDGWFWSERECKTPEELRLIGRALRITESGMARAVEVLKAAKIGAGKRLTWSGRALTSEMLRAEIESAVLRAGGIPANTIVACGNQACDPHERGSGPLRADSLIILDIFPRDARSGYFGDMTRTVVRGRASETQRRLWETVRAGQRMALRAMKPGASGSAIHEEVKAFFTRSGYPTEVRNGRWTGFFHGTGHGLGLEIHEEPRFARARFKPGHVMTVEPGLYYPGLGGVRIEDVAAVTRSGVRVLSRFPNVLEI